MSMRYPTIVAALAWIGIVALCAQLAMADEPSFKIKHRPEVAALASSLGGEQSAQLRYSSKVFPDQHTSSSPEALDGYGEYFEAEVSDSSFCRRVGFLRDRITGIVYPRYYSRDSIEAALKFAAARIMGNQMQRGERDDTVVATKVAEESARISTLTPLQDRLIPVQLGQNEETDVYYYSRGRHGNAIVICQASDFYKRCSVDGNLQSLGFDSSIHRKIFKKPDIMSCYFLAFERVSRQALGGEQ